MRICNDTHVQRQIGLLALLLALGLTACAHKSGNTRIDPAPHELVREDWLVVKLQKNGPKEVLTRQQLAEYRAKGVKIYTPSSLEKKPPMLLTAAPPLRVGIGKVRTFMIEDTPIRRITISGGNAEAYWTKPYMIRRRETTGAFMEHQGADFHLKGLAAGSGQLEVEFEDGRANQLIPLEVGGGAPTG